MEIITNIKATTTTDAEKKIKTNGTVIHSIYGVFPFSFNVIIAFATNYLLQQGVQNATTTARYGVDDAQAFLKATSEQSNHILVKNYDELAVHLELMLMGELKIN